MKRREFLSSVSLVLAASPLTPSAHASDHVTSGGSSLDREQWTCIEAIQDHLLPSEPGAPGSRDITATAYLDRALADPKFDPEVKEFIFNGIGWLQEIAGQEEDRLFHLVEPDRREDLLQQIARSEAGKRWLSTLVTYTLEALLADPLYGGNPDGIGWKWLSHDPGRPRPTPDKLYGRLGRT